MESLSDIAKTLLRLRDVGCAGTNTQALLRIETLHVPDDSTWDAFAFSQTFWNSFPGFDLIKVWIPDVDDKVYKSPYFRTIEACLVFCRGLNRVFQHQIYYKSTRPFAVYLASFDCSENTTLELKPQNAPEFYLRAPNEIQCEIFGLKYLKYFLPSGRPDIPVSEIEKCIVDYANQRLRVTNGNWFFTKPDGKPWESLDELLYGADKRYVNSFNEPIDWEKYIGKELAHMLFGI